MTIVITDDDVKRLLSMEECIDAMRTAFADLADGKAASLLSSPQVLCHS